MTSSYELVARYAETDAQGVVHHRNYLTWFEEGRSDFLRQRGLNYSDMERGGFFVVVAEAQVKYKSPAFYEDRVVVTTTLQRIKGKVLEFSYRVERNDGTLLCTGQTIHVVVGADKRPVNLPSEWAQKIGVERREEIFSAG